MVIATAGARFIYCCCGKMCMQRVKICKIHYKFVFMYSFLSKKSSICKNLILVMLF